MSKRPGTWIRRLGGAALIATMGATAIGIGAAGASTTGATGTSGSRLTAEQRECVKANFTRDPGHPRENLKELRAAAKTCGVTVHPRRMVRRALRNLSADQKQCLTEHGAVRPEGRPTAEQFRTNVAAFKACGITLRDLRHPAGATGTTTP